MLISISWEAQWNRSVLLVCNSHHLQGFVNRTLQNYFASTLIQYLPFCPLISLEPYRHSTTEWTDILKVVVVSGSEYSVAPQHNWQWWQSHQAICSICTVVRESVKTKSLTMIYESVQEVNKSFLWPGSECCVFWYKASVMHSGGLQSFFCGRKWNGGGSRLPVC